VYMRGINMNSNYMKQVCWQTMFLIIRLRNYKYYDLRKVLRLANCLSLCGL
jgi:hypothetical protein